MFKVRGQALHLFLLKLRVTFDSAPGCVDGNSRVTKILLKKSLEINPGQGSYLNLIFLLVPAKTNMPTKKKGGKRGAVLLSDAGSIEIVLTLLTKVVAFYMTFSNRGLEIVPLVGFFLAFPNNLLEEMSPCRVL